MAPTIDMLRPTSPFVQMLKKSQKLTITPKHTEIEVSEGLATGVLKGGSPTVLKTVSLKVFGLVDGGLTENAVG